jgi:endonuclease-3 related protein
MPTFDEAFPTILDALTQRYGSTPPPIAPGLDPFEAIVAVFLARSGRVRQHARVLNALRDGGLLEPEVLAHAEPAELIDALRAAGISSPQTLVGPLQRLARWIVEQPGGSAELLLDPDVPTTVLRDELANLRGIGRATADAILLFALGRPAYPVDRPIYRVLVRHGWIDLDTDYDDARALLERQSPDDPGPLIQVAGAMERVGREFCKPRTPRCEPCPLRPLLPPGGPYEPDFGEAED